MYSLMRSFQPVGQGAFYTERHTPSGFNVVYDCGTSSKKGPAKGIVRGAFNNPAAPHSKTQIDALFISHFDDDHVNLIEELKKTYIIKRVFIPLIEKSWMNVYTALGLTPQALFAQDTLIIQINDQLEGQGRSINLGELNGASNYSGGTRFAVPYAKWHYIPFNIRHTERQRILLSKFKKHDINIEDLENLEFVLHNKNRIKDIYKSLEDGINSNSLVIISVPTDNVECLADYYWHHNYNFMPKHFLPFGPSCKMPGCLYLGDFDARNNFDDLNRVISRYNNIGTIQIPHHGSLMSFNEKLVVGGRLCAISHGQQNKYGHPSTFVKEKILENGSIPLSITDNLDSAFITEVLYR